MSLAANVSLVEEGIRSAVKLPKRFDHIDCAAARVTKALGVPRYSFQYFSSLGRILDIWIGKPASQFSVLSALASPGKSGISARSAYGSWSGTTARMRNELVLCSRR